MCSVIILQSIQYLRVISNFKVFNQSCALMGSVNLRVAVNLQKYCFNQSKYTLMTSVQPFQLNLQLQLHRGNLSHLVVILRTFHLMIELGIFSTQKADFAFVNS